MVRRNDYNNDQYANEFGIKVTDELVTVDARVLPAPTVSVLFYIAIGFFLFPVNSGSANKIYDDLMLNNSAEVW